MKTNIVELTESCKLVAMTYDNGHLDVELTYTEHTTDHWHPDTETDVEITRENAQEIVALLVDAFELDIAAHTKSSNMKAKTQE